MRIRPTFVILTSIAALTACERTTVEPLDVPATSRLESRADAVPGRYIVVFRDDVPDAPGLAAQLSARAGGSLHLTYSHALKGFAASLPSPAVQALANNPNVLFVVPDIVVRAEGVQTGAGWGLDRIDQTALPLDGLYHYDGTGQDVNVYVVDSGIRITHNDFGGRAAHAVTFVDDSFDDCHGHGTHVAGIIGGATYGVAKNVRLWNVRVLNCSNSGFLSSVIAAVDWITAHHVKPAVANLSLSAGAGTASGDALELAINGSIETGVTFVVAAGNIRTGDSGDACERTPARMPAALTMAGSTSSDARATNSNWGNCVDLFAPGAQIVSSWNTGNNASASLTGTSMAAAFGSGVAALVLESQPDALPLVVRTAIREAATPNAISGANGGPNDLLYSLGSWGEPEPPPPPPPPPPPENEAPVVSITSPSPGAVFVEGEAVLLEGSGSDPEDGALGGAALAWSSDRDGALGNGTQLTVTTLSAGSHVLTLTVTDSEGATGSASVSITVQQNQAPVASFTYQCSNSATCRFTDRSSDDEAVTSWYWTFGNGQSSTQSNPSTTYASPGAYVVELVVSDRHGRTGSATATINCELHRNGRLRCS
jgi:subtilisin family serine protease